MTRTRGWEGLVRVEEKPRTTTPVPCHSGGSAGLGPLYSYRTSWVRVLPSGAASGMAGRKKGKKRVVYPNVSQHVTTKR